MSDPYWRIFAEEATSDLGIDLTPEQVDELEQALIGAHENYGLHSGRDVVDANYRANEKRESEWRGAERVLRHIEACVSRIDGGPSACFAAMSHNQRLAMHELFQARQMLARKETTP